MFRAFFGQPGMCHLGQGFQIACLIIAPPLDKVAKKYGSDLESFIAQGIALGGQKKEFGDAAWQVYPVPRISVLIVLWREDEEFPPRAELLFDQIPTTYLPIDVLWSFAMMCINAIL